MIDTSMIALDDLIEQEAGICLGKRNGYGEKATRKGACPFCGGTDRFAVFVNDMPMHFYCGIHGHGCNKRGDAITFLREYYHISFHEACQKLELDTGTKYKRTQFSLQPPYVPCDTWQEQAKVFASECKDRLWSEEGKAVLAYLRSDRKLSDETIQRAGLGYNPTRQKRTRDTSDLWGLPETYEKLFIARGITIPWQVDGKLLRVDIRRFKTDILQEEQRTGKKASKYIPVTGGSTTSIYGFDYADYNKPLVLVEGEFDKMLLSQEVQSVNAIATGSNCNGRLWPLQLAHFPIVLVAFDVDEDNKAGESGAAFWLNNIPHAIAWYPLAHDITDMMIEGHDLNSWVQSGIHLAITEINHVHKEVETPQETVQWVRCSQCKHDVTAFHHGSICYHCWFHNLPDATKRYRRS